MNRTEPANTMKKLAEKGVHVGTSSWKYPGRVQKRLKFQFFEAHLAAMPEFADPHEKRKCVYCGKSPGDDRWVEIHPATPTGICAECAEDPGACLNAAMDALFHMAGVSRPRIEGDDEPKGD